MHTTCRACPFTHLSSLAYPIQSIKRPWGLVSTPGRSLFSPVCQAFVTQSETPRCVPWTASRARKKKSASAASDSFGQEVGTDPRNHNFQLQALAAKLSFSPLSDQKYGTRVMWYLSIPAKDYSRDYNVPGENERPYWFITSYHSDKSRTQDICFRICPALTFRHCTSRCLPCRSEVLMHWLIYLFKDV